MGYERVSESDVERHELEEIEPDLLPIGVELRPEEMRPSVWAYEAGESSTRHYQREQEELYVPLEGEFELALEGKEDEEEAIDIGPGDYVVVDPETVRQVTALADGRLLVVGAPNAKDDGVVVD